MFWQPYELEFYFKFLCTCKLAYLRTLAYLRMYVCTYALVQVLEHLSTCAIRLLAQVLAQALTQLHTFAFLRLCKYFRTHTCAQLASICPLAQILAHLRTCALAYLHTCVLAQFCTQALAQVGLLALCTCIIAQVLTRSGADLEGGGLGGFKPFRNKWIFIKKTVDYHNNNKV